MVEFSEKFLPFVTKRARYKVAYGGRNGSKSHNIATALLIKGKREKLLIACLREFQKNLEDSVLRLLSNKIRASKKLSRHYRIMSDKIIGRNGTEFIFSGIKNAVNFKSFEGADIAWVEEAQTISAESLMILEPTIRKYQSELWFSFNPDSEDDTVYDFVKNPREATAEELKAGGYDTYQITLQINYYDNSLCPAVMIKAAEDMKKKDYDLFRHVWLGECRTASDSIIFKDKYEVKDFEVVDDWGVPRFNGDVIDMRHGLDWGFMHPAAIIESFEYKGDIYITEEIVGQEMQIDNITLRIVNELKYAKNKRIFADSARPDLIENIKYSRMGREGAELPGLWVEPANKGPGSVESGITWLKNHGKIYIHPRCQNTILNFKKYSYKKTKDDIITMNIVKLYDDCIDALRYSYSQEISEGNYGIDWNDQEFLQEIHSQV